MPRSKVLFIFNVANVPLKLFEAENFPFSSPLFFHPNLSCSKASVQIAFSNFINRSNARRNEIYSKNFRERIVGTREQQHSPRDKSMEISSKHRNLSGPCTTFFIPLDRLQFGSSFFLPLRSRYYSHSRITSERIIPDPWIFSNFLSHPVRRSKNYFRGE